MGRVQTSRTYKACPPLISLLLILLFILFLTCLLLEIHLALELMLMAGVCDGATVLRIYLDVLWRGLAWGCARRTACRPSYGVVGTASACILLHAETGGRTPRLTDSSRVTPVCEILIAPGPRRTPPRKSSYRFWNKSLMKVSAYYLRAVEN